MCPTVVDSFLVDMHVVFQLIENEVSLIMNDEASYFPESRTF